MKNFVYLTFFFVLSCSQQDEKIPTIETSLDKTQDQSSKPQTDIQTAEIKPGEFIEYYPGGGIKMKGVYNENLQREGLWISYYESGVKWSEAYYSNGLRDGHNLTFYPNGKMRYIGEYKNEKKIGTWTFYDEEGNVTKTENY